ncbi:hypothetical protein J6590_004263 [Homalodisca vitripennis]|nr:hypothetical protein J6590_004263 [Homalodisca vitripennis]
MFRVLKKIAAVDPAESLHFWNNSGLYVQMYQDQDIHSCQTRGRENYRTGQHRTVVYERLPSHTGVHFINKLPHWIKNALKPKALKTRLKRF